MRSCIIMLVLGVAAAAAVPPEFYPYTLVHANGVPIEVTSGHADPCVIDWDGDGIQDLLLGQYGSGNIRFYANSGTNDSPIFTVFEYVQADGSPISVPSG